MPTTDRRLALDLEAARERVAAAAFGTSGNPPSPGRVGLEPEIFPIRLSPDAGPRGRASLAEPGGVLDILDRFAGREAWIGPREGGGSPVYPLASGGRLTFEPGAQIEHSSAVHLTAAGALQEVGEVVSRLAHKFAEQGVALAHAGLDLWHDLSTVPQQLEASRYRAMSRYFESRGPYGAIMMRHSASMQVNLDLGPSGVAQERWLLSNMVSPLVTATFAASPGDAAVSVRALAWQQLDPTRTGFPTLLVESTCDDPAEIYREAAMAADVMLFWTGPSEAEPGEPGFTFERWIREGHTRFGWPTAKDLDYHLTTLFFEVRPRGFLELRAPDALPDPWRPVSVVLLAGLLYDEQARDEGLKALDGMRSRLPDLWNRAARAGLGDAEIGTLASRIWETALVGARRLPEGFIREVDFGLTRRFLERYTFRRRMPSDELREALQLGPVASLRWAVGDTNGDTGAARAQSA